VACMAGRGHGVVMHALACPLIGSRDIGAWCYHNFTVRANTLSPPTCPDWFSRPTRPSRRCALWAHAHTTLSQLMSFGPQHPRNQLLRLTPRAATTPRKNSVERALKPTPPYSRILGLTTTPHSKFYVCARTHTPSVPK
jgi:hypothetical protein